MFDGLDLRGAIFALVLFTSIVFLSIGGFIGWATSPTEIKSSAEIKPYIELYINEKHKIDTLYVYKFSEAK